MRKWLVAAAVLALAPLSWAQQKPDFSGTWKLDPLKSRTDQVKEPKDLVLKIEHKEPAVHVSLAPGGDFDLMIDSTIKEVHFDDVPGFAMASWDRWQGDHLILQTTRKTPSGDVVTIRELRLGDKGKILTTVLTVRDKTGEHKAYEFFVKE
jgi:hypothetical protein